ncbi:aldo/keto reductase [Mumia zhuanghuii]|uniref:Aldo/keto reductase n=2 Tax=Mumia TaxID=1546255 RepID=A0ABW1QJV6_9ACTN|nr:MULTISPECIES: aldo/keto reductase [Mumia]KAA1419811.1 aldo/keto reductase [Mumia zhuanghuii]
METPRTFLADGDHAARRIGFGAMQLPTSPGAARDASTAVLRRAVALGVPLVDTAHLYGWGANEELVAEALHPWPSEVMVATKVGVVRDAATGDWTYDGRPESLRRQVDEGLRRLRVEQIALLQLHRVDPATPLADQVGALDELRREGKIARIGLSEVSVEQLQVARDVADVASVQNRYSVFDREYEPVLAACEAAGVAFLPWRPVAGAASGSAAATAVAAIGREVGATPAQVALAWLLAHSAALVPIPGTKQVAHLEENVAAGQVTLTGDHLRRLDALNDLHDPGPS